MKIPTGMIQDVLHIEDDDSASLLYVLIANSTDRLIQEVFGRDAQCTLEKHQYSNLALFTATFWREAQ